MYFLILIFKIIEYKYESVKTGLYFASVDVLGLFIFCLCRLFPECGNFPFVLNVQTVVFWIVLFLHCTFFCLYLHGVCDHEQSDWTAGVFHSRHVQGFLFSLWSDLPRTSFPGDKAAWAWNWSINLHVATSPVTLYVVLINMGWHLRILTCLMQFPVAAACFVSLPEEVALV